MKPSISSKPVEDVCAKFKTRSTILGRCGNRACRDVTVVDSETQEVIRQIPPEELLSLSQHLADSLENQTSGFLLQTKA